MKKVFSIILLSSFSTLVISSDPIIDRAFPLFQNNLSELGKNKIVEDVMAVGCKNWDTIVSILIEKNIKTQTAIGYSNLVRSLNSISHDPVSVCEILGLLETTQIKKEVYSLVIKELVKTERENWFNIIEIINLCNPKDILPYSLQNLVFALSKSNNLEACKSYVEENASLNADYLAGRLLKM